MYLYRLTGWLIKRLANYKTQCYCLGIRGHSQGAEGQRGQGKDQKQCLPFSAIFSISEYGGGGGCLSLIVFFYFQLYWILERYLKLIKKSFFVKFNSCT